MSDKVSAMEQHYFALLQELQREIIESTPKIPLVAKPTGLSIDRLRYFAGRLAEAHTK